MFLANKNHRLTETVARYSTLSAEAAQNVFIANTSRKRILVKTLIYCTIRIPLISPFQLPNAFPYESHG